VTRILPNDAPTLSDHSYLVHDGRAAFVMDPQRDIDLVPDPATLEGVQIIHVFETRIHNDYLTGGPALAAATGAVYHLNADDPVTLERVCRPHRRHGHGQRHPPGASPGHPRSHPHPPVVLAGSRQTGVSRDHEPPPP
jgi:hypothetical protein